MRSPGDIVAVGSKVTDRKVGDRVSCETHIPCGKCYFCKNGMPHLCRDVKLFGCDCPTAVLRSIPRSALT